MLFTKECDYAIRILRVLRKGDTVNVSDISTSEDMSVQITYKAARKLEKAGIIESFRGVNGGYALKKPLSELSLYDVFSVIDKDLFITECVNHNFDCSRNTAGAPCGVHREYCRIQGIINQELKAKTLLEIMEEALRPLAIPRSER